MMSGLLILSRPPAVDDPVADILQTLEPAYAVLPLFDYGWTLLVQGQLGAATYCLRAVVDLAGETAQPSIASAAYHQLAVTARILGDMEQSQKLNDQSVAINRAVPGAAAELASMWPRISSAFLSLQAGRLDEAERRLSRVVRFLDGRNAFYNYRNSANIGLGLVALAHDDRATAHACSKPPSPTASTSTHTRTSAPCLDSPASRISTVSRMSVHDCCAVHFALPASAACSRSMSRPYWTLPGFVLPARPLSVCLQPRSITFVRRSSPRPLSSSTVPCIRPPKTPRPC